MFFQLWYNDPSQFQPRIYSLDVVLALPREDHKLAPDFWEVLGSILAQALHRTKEIFFLKFFRNHKASELTNSDVMDEDLNRARRDALKTILSYKTSALSQGIRCTFTVDGNKW